MILNTVVVDDEPLAAGLIEKYVLRNPDLHHAGTFYSAQEAVKTILAGNVQLVLLDIKMPGLSGVEFARCIPPGTSVIFTTAYPDYAIESFKVDAVDYLLKPISYEDFCDAVGRAMRRQSLVQAAAKASDFDATGTLIVKSEYKQVPIPLAQLEWVEGLKDYVKIHVKGWERPVLTLMSMKAIEKALPPGRFMRVHRSWIVNTRAITRIERGHIMIGSQSIPVSDSYRDAFHSFVASHSPAETR